ncbi:MAG: cupin domain-containing protein [Saprospiraceae bacterium]
MFKKSLLQIPAFTAGDATQIREWLHPKNDGVDLPYSVAFAELEPGTASLPHILQTRTEVYLVLEGEGVAYMGGQAQTMQPNDLILIPAGVEQYVENVGDTVLKFICIVSPPWSKEDEMVY